MSKAPDKKNLPQALRDLAQQLEDGAAPSPVLARRMKEAIAEWRRQLAQVEMPLAPAAAPGENNVSSSLAPADEIHIWCDGSCAPNPGAGGWAAIVEMQGQRQELSGASPTSTNNIMELTAAIQGLRATPPGSRVVITTDSQDVKNGITLWIKGWKRRGWRKADGEPVLNQGLWQELDLVTAQRKVRWEWTRGHSGHPENERCDELANSARKSLG